MGHYLGLVGLPGLMPGENLGSETATPLAEYLDTATSVLARGNVRGNRQMTALGALFECPRRMNSCRAKKPPQISAMPVHKDLNEELEPVREALKAMGKADALKLDDEGGYEKEAAAGGEASKATAVAHVVYRAAEIAIHILCIWFILRILCIAVLAISARWCIQWMGRASELPASIPPATRRGAFAKRLARRRASRAAKRAGAG